MDWTPIGTEVQLLTANQQRIKDMLDTGRSIWSICGVMRMRREHVIDEIYEIRKKEANMSKPKKTASGKLNNAQKAAIYQAYKDGIATQQQLAKQYGVCNQAISYTIKRMRESEESMAAAVDLPAAAQVPAPEPERKPAVENNPIEKATKGLETIAKTAAQVLGVKQNPEKKPAAINQEFENAIDKMIEDAKAEKNAANAEKKSEIAEVPKPEPELEDVENGIPNTPLVPDQAISPVIRRLVTYGISDMESEIEEREQRIAELKMEIEEFRKDIAIAKEWKEQQKWR